MRRLRNNKKGLSVIFGVLILIAIAVIAGIIIYMYTSGYLSTMLGGGTTGQEKVAIQTVSVATATSTKVWATSSGGGDVTIKSAILRNAQGQTVEVSNTIAGNPITKDGATVQLTVTWATGTTVGETYTLALVSNAGNQFVSASFKA